MEEPSKFASFSPTIRRVISRRVLLAALMAIVCVLLVNMLALRNPAKFARPVGRPQPVAAHEKSPWLADKRRARGGAVRHAVGFV